MPHSAAPHDDRFEAPCGPLVPPALSATPAPATLGEATATLARAARPVTLGGKRAPGAAAALRVLAEALDVLVVRTINARGLLAGHALSVPAPPSLPPVRDLLRDAPPGVPILGDSTEPVYASNLLFEPSAPGGWANSSTGFGTLGWGLPAAIGHALATGQPTLALVGDGGLQFTLAELGTLADEGAPVTVLVWNNAGYREIETAMREAGAEPVGVTPSAPDFVAVARAYGLRAERANSLAALPVLLRAVRGRPSLIDLPAHLVHPG